jgi:hypothetical protein
MDTKQAHKERWEAKLAHAQARMDALKALAKETTADAKIAVGKQMEELEYSIAQAKQQLAECAHAGEDKWHGIKSSLAGAWANLTRAFRRDPAGRSDDDGVRK